MKVNLEVELSILYVGLSSPYIHIWLTIIFIHFVKFYHLVSTKWNISSNFMDEFPPPPQPHPSKFIKFHHLSQLLPHTHTPRTLNLMAIQLSSHYWKLKQNGVVLMEGSEKLCGWNSSISCPFVWMKSRSVDGRKKGFVDETGWTSSLPPFAPVVVHVMHGTVAAAVACLENCVAVLPRSLAPSLARRNFTKPTRRLQYPICCYYLQLNFSLQFQFPDLQVYREAFAEEETDGETERQKKWQVSGSLRALSSRRWEWWKNGAGSRM